MAKLFANSGDPDQVCILWHPIWVCPFLPFFTFLGFPDLNGLNLPKKSVRRLGDWLEMTLTELIGS